MNRKNIFKIFIVIIIIGVLAYIVFSKLLAPEPLPQGHVAFVVISDSGSTNTIGYDLTLYADGSGSLQYGQMRYDSNAPLSNRHQDYPSGTYDVQKLEKDLQKIGDVGNIDLPRGCEKSASFGTTLSITYKGKISGDLSCAYDNVITSDVEAITKNIKTDRYSVLMNNNK
jgi:uncharacterized membrane protein YdfJ with MMPL/SSD domain